MVLNSVLLGDEKAQNSKNIKKTNLIPSYLSVIFLFFKYINQFIIILNINVNVITLTYDLAILRCHQTISFNQYQYTTFKIK